MTSPSQQTNARRWLLPFLAALIAALIAALAAILLATTTSATAAGAAETRVGAFNVAVEVLVEPPQHVSAGQHPGEAEISHRIAVATGVAANSAPKALNASSRVAPWAGSSLSRLSREGEVMYRVYGGGAGKAGSWLTPINPVSSAAARQGLGKR